MPVYSANQVLSQFNAYGFVLSIGMLSPPPLTGTDEEKIEYRASLRRFRVDRATIGELIN